MVCQKGVCLNVNFPKVEKFAGLKVCRMGWGSWTREVEACKHPRGFDYYWMTGIIVTTNLMRRIMTSGHWSMDM